jgi:hypothetical protein
MASVDEIVDYYTNLLIIQYHNKPKAQAMVALFVREMIASNILMQIRDGYNIDTAVGLQLDVIGKYVGVDRFYTGQTFSGFFSFIIYSEVNSPPSDRIGFADYTDFETKEGKWLQYSDVLSGSLSLGDEDYRVLIKLKIIQNNINHSHQAIDDAMFEFFGTDVYADSVGNMEMYYFVPVDRSNILTVALQKDLLPRPMGVRLNYVIEQNEDFFGFATYDGYSSLITGFSTYADFESKAGETLTYDKLLEA